ncbi:hypothetical protein [Burkholderia cenocepacia]|uniref:hypothetical protein n=1 Tax=Burkholderia cenocepacia TaxID=95486 RepID=UPI001F4B1DFD|nr:hypothetical protein [Burkholderia cenocepacia]
MNNAQHTPGPWKFSRWDEHGDTRFYVSQQDGAPYTPNYSDVATVIAETCSGERVRIQEANARLIVAAPELLESLQKMNDMWNSICDVNGWDPEHNVQYVEARAAIAKATGS